MQNIKMLGSKIIFILSYILMIIIIKIKDRFMRRLETEIFFSQYRKRE